MFLNNICVAGSRGLVGAAVMRQFSKQLGNSHLIGISRADVDFRDRDAVFRLMGTLKPDCVIICAAKVGGIHANDTYPRDFLSDNLLLQCNLIDAAHQAGVSRLIFLGSSCIYPKNARQPMTESELMSSFLEPTNEPYALAKIAGIKLCESYRRQFGSDFRSLMPTNLYGPNDNFHPMNSHVIPALIRKFVEARKKAEPEVEIWGSGEVRREFLHVDDLAKAILHFALLSEDEFWDGLDPRCSHINIGSGTDISIKDLALKIADFCGYFGNIVFDKSRPDGPIKKLLNVGLAEQKGWVSEISLDAGLPEAISYFEHVFAEKIHE